MFVLNSGKPLDHITAAVPLVDLKFSAEVFVDFWRMALLNLPSSFLAGLIRRRKIPDTRYQMAIYPENPENNLLNKRTEIVAKYRHMNNFYLAIYDSRD